MFPIERRVEQLEQQVTELMDLLMALLLIIKPHDQAAYTAIQQAIKTLRELRTQSNQ